MGRSGVNFARLSSYAAVVFLLTTGTVVEAPQRKALERFIADGNGFAGVHSAADTEYDWSWYGALLGAFFSSHPDIQQATVHIDDTDHPTRGSAATSGTILPLIRAATRVEQWAFTQLLGTTRIRVAAPGTPLADTPASLIRNRCFWTLPRFR